MDGRDAARYRQHLRLPDIGPAGQQRLADAAVLVVGAGGLGCPALIHLVAAGVGRVGVCDDDRVELDNLPRQILYGDADVGRGKAAAAVEHLSRLNPACRLEVIDQRLAVGNAASLLTPYDLVLDGTDDLATRFLIHDACFLLTKNLVAAAIHQHDGQLLNFSFAQARNGTPCLRCLWPTPPHGAGLADCRRAGVLATVAGVFGALLAHEAVKVILGLAHLAAGEGYHLDLLDLAAWRSIWQRREDCPLCGIRPTLTELDAATHPDPASFELSWADASAAPAVVWVDVRGREESEASPAPKACGDAVRCLWREDVLDDLDKDRPHVLFCGNGRRSRALVAGLRAAGETRVFSLRGGLAGVRGQI